MNTPMNTPMNTLIAAPEQAPGSAAGIIAGGSATVIGLILLALLINDWKKMTRDTKKAAIMTLFMVVCLTGAGGVVGGLLSSAKTTAGTVGTTLTQTTTGQ